MMHRSHCLAALLLALAGCHSDPPVPTGRAATHEACQFERATTVPVRLVQGFILIPAVIDRKPVQLVVDTGASTSMLTHDAVTLLGLPTDPFRTTTVEGTGGKVVTHDTSFDSLRIGNQSWTGHSLTTGTMPVQFHEDPPVVGLLGTDQLVEYDIELDVPHHVMTLWNVQHCSGDFVPWRRPHDTLKLARHLPYQMVAPIAIDGHKVAALIDWGSRSTTVTSATAERLGVTAEMLAQDRVGRSRGVDANNVAAYVHRFAGVQIGSETFHNTDLLVAPLNLTDVGALLGADYVSTRHVWLSYASQQLFVQPPEEANAQP